jgi:hypothetical protein
MPGSGVGVFDGCSKQWSGDYDFGKRYGGVSNAGGCEGLPAEIRGGCEFRFGFFEGADNPDVDYVEVKCPAELTSRSGCTR